jgi:hypothetical protein
MASHYSLVMNNKNIRNIFIEALNDPTLKNTIDVDAILEAIDKTDVDDLGNKCLADLCKETHESLMQFDIDEHERSELCKKLAEYRLVDEIYKLHKGKHVRWIREQADKPYLTNGGIVVDVKFLDNGIHVVCKNKNRFIQYKFDDCITFQKLSADEQLILSCYELT